MTSEPMTTTFAWHVHHDRLMEPLTEPIEARIAYIKATKPKAEHALRLRLLKPVQRKIPKALAKARAACAKAGAAYAKAGAACDKAGAAHDKARAACDKAGAAYEKAWAAYAKAWAAYAKAWADAMPALEALHAKECPDCPWDGQTIFARKVNRS